MATCGNCGSKHTIAGVRACYAARYSADAPRGYVATKQAAAQPPAPVERPAPVEISREEAEALERRRQAAANLAGLRSRVRKARSARSSSASVMQVIRDWSPERALSSDCPF